MQIKEAVGLASRYLPEVFSSAEGQDIRPEGLEKSDDGLFWKVTFSYFEPKEPDTYLKGMMPVPTPLGRVYKTIKLRDTNGELMGAQNGLLLQEL